MKLKLGEKEVEAEQISFVPASEPWAEYHLEDGAVIRMKLVATKIYRLEGEKDADGNPAYFIKSSNVTDVTPKR